jgi:hypothetical protein
MTLLLLIKIVSIVLQGFKKIFFTLYLLKKFRIN